MFVRDLDPGMGLAVAERSIFRKKEDGTSETWGDVAKRVAVGNCSLHPTGVADVELMEKFIAQGALLMSGRHLQHTDEHQAERNIELLSNCSTASTSFMLYMLLLNGSGVGRNYSPDVMLVDWRNMPDLYVSISKEHPDWTPEWEDTDHAIERLESSYGINLIIYHVEDSREGWAAAIETLETLAWEGTHGHMAILFDFSEVRGKGCPIRGMQNRPAAGPIPTMEAFLKIGSVKWLDWEPWKQTLFVDHYLAENVLVGGARRAARIALMDWERPEAIEFATVKKDNPGTLWSANNSILTTEKFWREAAVPGTHAHKLFKKASAASYRDGEPGFVNVDKLEQDETGVEALYDVHTAFGSPKFQLTDAGGRLMTALLKAFESYPYKNIVNPCSEISIRATGAYCVIADFVPLFTADEAEAEQVVRLAVRALIRTNLLPAFYQGEVNRTNRIGVGFTGIHECAWEKFGFGFEDLLDEEKSTPFWNYLKRLSDCAKDEAVKYAAILGVNPPMTVTTVKPAGSTSKLFALSEGAHLLAKDFYLRWVQFRSDAPELDEYRQAGYPTKTLTSYRGTTVVGFPTRPRLAGFGMGDKLVLAGQATLEQHFKWLSLIEKYWIGSEKGNQVSYTAKFNPEVTSLDDFRRILLEWQPEIKCCSVLPQMNLEGVYEYVPEELISERDYTLLQAEIFAKRMKRAKVRTAEKIDDVHLLCDGGACPL